MLTATLSTHPATTVARGFEMVDDENIVGRNRGVIRSICEAIVQFRELSSTMPVGEVQMFLTVALNEGMSLTELAEKADMKKSTASRYLLDLSDKTRAGGAGYGLITREADPEELRRNMYALSPKGRKIVQRLVAANSNSKD
jgi:DNA-binding MarR family transcriptional regulator